MIIKELKNIRSYNDLLRALNKIATDISADQAALDKLTSVLVSTSSDDDSSMEIGRTVEKRERPKPGTVIVKGKSKVGSAPTAIVPIHKTEVDADAIPDGDTLKSIARYATIVNTLFTRIENIKVARHIATTSFGTMDSVDDFVASTDKMLTEVNYTIDKAFKLLSGIAQKHAPKKLNRISNEVKKFFMEKVTPDMYSTFKPTIHIAPVKKGNTVEAVLYAIYLTFKDFKLSPDRSIGGRGFSYREFCVIITAKVKVDSGLVTYHITAQPQFSLPGNYDIGKWITSEKNAIEELKKLVSYYNFSMFIDRKPLAFDDNTINPIVKLKGVQRVKVRNDSIVVLLKAGAAHKDKVSITATVLRLLRDAYGEDVIFAATDTRSMKLNNKTTGEDEKHEVIHFICTSKKDLSKAQQKLHRSNTEKLRRLQEELGLSFDDMVEIKKLIWK